ncbi:VOC family protein [Actinomadura monticuli]|uniref:VOC family protein n=1 Tax=Actinomadura monticuli TaxID=3097367 RepID=A0ABV4QCQ4_9ACTN
MDASDSGRGTTGHVLGTPFWVEIASPDVDASRRFYGELFGWYAYTLTIGEYGDYVVFTLRDINGPGVGSMQRLADDTQAPSWSCYFYTADLEATLDDVRSAGGDTLMDPVNVAQMGNAALCSDTQGAEFALWEPLEPDLVPVAGEPGTMCWAELAARDIQAARRFYGAVFGWKAVDRDYYGAVYTDWEVDGWPAAGMVAMDERWPPDYPAHWIPYFQVADCDASAALAVELGARIRVPPSDVQNGRFSILTDPTGVRFAVLEPNPEARARFDPRR